MFKRILMIIGTVAILAAIHTYAPGLWDAVFQLVGQGLDQISGAYNR